MKPIRTVLSVTCCVLLAAACAPDSELNEMSSTELSEDDAWLSDEFVKCPDNIESIDEDDLDSESLEQDPADLAEPDAEATVPDDEKNDFPFPGADTIALHGGSDQYITYGASAKYKGKRYRVPYAKSGSGNIVRTSPNIDGDSMCNGAGAWAKTSSRIWTPGAFYHKGRYYLFYTATHRNDNGRKCIGIAWARKPEGPFKAAPKPLRCPTKGDRWAIDADVTTGPNGTVWMTWRDGQLAEGKESALSAMKLKFKTNGKVESDSAPVVLMRSDDLTWAHYHDGPGVTVIENPSALYHKGSWYLFYSGNKWHENFYSTGIAYCGKKLGDGPCKPLPGPNRAWFSYSGPKKHLPGDMRRYELPGNKRGPGAMDVYRARNGKPWVTWNYLSGPSGHKDRKSRVGRLVITGSGKQADFKVKIITESGENDDFDVTDESGENDDFDVTDESGENDDSDVTP